MDVFDTVRTVLAVRAFQDKPIPPEAVHRIVEAARLTASSRNGQPWHFIVIQNRDTLRQIGQIVKTGSYTAQAALAIVVVIDHASEYGVSDGSRAIQSMILTAWSEGIGSNWTGWLGMPQINKLLGIPDDHDVLGIIPFGYAAKNIGKGKKNRKPASEVVFHEKYGKA